MRTLLLFLQQYNTTFARLSGTTVSHPPDCPKPAPWWRCLYARRPMVVILPSCTKVSDLAVGECWCMVASPLTEAQTSTSSRDGPPTTARYRDERSVRPIASPYAAAIGR
ncbi:hypothetical protein TNCV_2125391 [Trichonephila clavipes]|nr:hypothetical protein TNCV_2125391 [Trichonephila clavipes]